MAENRLFDVNSNIERFVLKSSITGQGLTGLTNSSTGLIISTICDNEASATSYTAAGSTIETISTLGTYAAPTATKCRFKEVDATNHPGLYEFQFADARYSVTSAKKLIITVTGASNLLTTNYEIALVKYNPYDDVLGMTVLDTLSNKLPAKDYLTGTNNESGDIETQDSTGGFNDTQKEDIRLEALTALDTAMPSSPTSSSVNEKVKTLLSYLGVPISVDSSAATITALILKIMDDNGGADFDATVDSLNKLSTQVGAGVPVSYAPTSETITVGDDEGGTNYTATTAHDGTYRQIGEVVGTGLDYVLTRSASTITEIPSLVRISGRYQGTASHNVGIYLWNYQLSAWVLHATMQSRTTDFDYIIPMGVDHHNAATGEMKIRFLHNVISPYIASHALYVDFVSFEKVESNNQMAADIASILAMVNDIDGEVDNIETIVEDLHDTDIPAIKAETALIVEDTGTTLPATLTTIEGKIDTIDDYVDAEVAAIKAQTDKLTFDASNNVAATISGTGANTVTITVNDGTNPVADVSLRVHNSSNDDTPIIAAGTSSALGVVTVYLADGTYKVRMMKAGYTFSVGTLTVSGATSQTFSGTAVSVGSPGSSYTCRVYEYLYNADDSTKPSSTPVNSCKIIKLPYDYQTKLHIGTEITPTYSSASGLIYWDVVYGATIEIYIKDFFGKDIRTVPASTTVRLSDMVS